MSNEQLTAEALALPMRQRVSLAQELWQSIHAGLPESEEQAAASEALRRDEELASGKTKGRSHAEVMRVAKKAIGCG
jgi:putative addiction module component (TIGR02574 family)